MSDYISKSALLKNLLDWRLQECPVGVCDEETETYKTICECIKAVEEQPTISETEIIRKAMERVVERLKEKAKQRWLVLAERNGYERAIEICNEEGGIE